MATYLLPFIVVFPGRGTRPTLKDLSDPHCGEHPEKAPNPRAPLLDLVELGLADGAPVKQPLCLLICSVASAGPATDCT